MGSTNYGNQIITYNFRGPGQSEYFNKLNYDILPRGIYTGGNLIKNTVNSVKVTASTVYVKDFSNKISVKINIKEDVIIGVAEQKPYIIGRFKWSGFGNDFLQIYADDFNSIEDDDIIFGRCVYLNGELKDQFDYTRREKPFLADIKIESIRLKVISTEPFSRRVKVKAGGIQTANKSIFINDTLSPELSDTINGRTDLICINSDGEIYTVEGEDSVSPITPSYRGRLVLAEVSRGPGESFITEADITNIKRKNFDFSQISIPGADTGAALIHSGSLQGYNTSDNLQEEMQNLFNQISTGKFLVTYGETITKNDPIGKDSEGKYRKATKSFEYDETLGVTGVFSTDGHLFRVISLFDYALMIWVDGTNTCKLKAFREDGVSVTVSNEYSLANNVLEFDITKVNRSSFVIGIGNSSDETILYSGYWDHALSSDITIDGGPLNPARNVSNTTTNIQVQELFNRTGGITDTVLIGWVDHTENVTRMTEEYGEEFYYQNKYNTDGGCLLSTWLCWPSSLQCHEAIEGTAPNTSWGMPDVAVIKYEKDTGLTIEGGPEFAYKGHPMMYDEAGLSYSPVQWPRWFYNSHTPVYQAYGEYNKTGNNRVIDNFILSIPENTDDYLFFEYYPSTESITLARMHISLFYKTTADTCPNLDRASEYDYYVYYTTGFNIYSSIMRYYYSDSGDIINRNEFNFADVGESKPRLSLSNEINGNFDYTSFPSDILNTITKIYDIEQFPQTDHDYTRHDIYVVEGDGLYFTNNLYISSTGQILTSHSIGDSECPFMTLRPDGGAVALLKDNTNDNYWFVFSPNTSTYDLFSTAVNITSLVDIQEPLSLNFVGSYVIFTYRDSTNVHRVMFYQSIPYEGIALENGIIDEQHFMIKSRKFPWGNNELTPYADYYVDYSTESIVEGSGDELIGFALNQNDLFLQ